MIYTGYYSKLNEYKAAGLKTVSISRSEPKLVEFDGKIPELCPDNQLLWDIKNGRIDEIEYTNKYLEQLERVGLRNILLKIHSFGDNVVLLCWEKPSSFCHRHILADYINKNTKLNIKEYE